MNELGVLSPSNALKGAAFDGLMRKQLCFSRTVDALLVLKTPGHTHLIPSSSHGRYIYTWVQPILYINDSLSLVLLNIIAQTI